MQTMDPNIMTYPIPGNTKGGLLHVYGRFYAKNLILCCGGYPDDHKPFAPLAQRLASEEDCMVGITCFPGFDLDTYQKYKYNGYKRTGYNFDEVAVSIREAVSRLHRRWGESNKTTYRDETIPKFTIILHDWGVIPGLMFINRAIETKYSPHVPDKIVLLDVLTMPHRQYKDLPRQKDVPYSLKPSMYELVVCISYRFALAISFVWLRFVSDIIGLINFAIFFQIIILLRLSPCQSFDHKFAVTERAQNASSPLPFYRHLVYMCYPYYYMFLCLICNTGFEDITIPLDLKATPILYIYGERKNIMFHDWRSLAILEREKREGRSDCRVVSVKDSGHWMYVQKLDVCLEEIKKFIKFK